MATSELRTPKDLAPSDLRTPEDPSVLNVMSIVLDVAARLLVGCHSRQQPSTIQTAFGPKARRRSTRGRAHLHTRAIHTARTYNRATIQTAFGPRQSTVAPEDNPNRAHLQARTKPNRPRAKVKAPLPVSARGIHKHHRFHERAHLHVINWKVLASDVVVEEPDNRYRCWLRAYCFPLIPWNEFVINRLLRTKCIGVRT